MLRYFDDLELEAHYWSVTKHGRRMSSNILTHIDWWQSMTGSGGEDMVVTPLVNALVSDDVNVITEIQEALAAFGEKALAPLREASQSDNPTLRENAIFCLTEMLHE